MSDRRVHEEPGDGFGVERPDSLKRSESPWHELTVEKVRVVDGDGGRDDVERWVEHPADCDQLKYGEECWFDREFFEITEDDELPMEPGVYRARVYLEGPDYWGEYDGGSEWESLGAEAPKGGT